MDDILDAVPLIMALGLFALAINRVVTKSGLARTVYIIGLIAGGILGAVMAYEKAMAWSWGLAIGVGASSVMAEAGSAVKRLIKSKAPAEPAAPTDENSQ